MRQALALLLGSLFCSFVAICFWPVDFLEFCDGEEILFAHPSPVGQKLATRYIHSLQKTSVEDDYYVVGGKLWGWEERIHSLGAGLPFTQPRNGRYIVHSGGMTVQGGRQAISPLFLRIGNERLGRNEIDLPPYKKYAAYKEIPKTRLTLRLKKKPLGYAPLESVQKRRLNFARQEH